MGPHGEAFAVEVKSSPTTRTEIASPSPPHDAAKDVPGRTAATWTVEVRELGSPGAGLLVIEEGCRSGSRAIRRARAIRRQIRLDGRLKRSSIGDTVMVRLRRTAVFVTIVAIVAALVVVGGGYWLATSGARQDSARAATTTSVAPSPVIPAALPSFYRVPDKLPAARPGTLLKAQRVAAPALHGTAYRVMYTSRSIQNRTVAVTGIIVVPNRPAPTAGYPMVTWAHGTSGMADTCAPSLHPLWSTPPFENGVLDRGLEITATDYQGEGTPGLLPYLAGVSAARNAIDIVRAARHLAAAHASRSYVVWGYSEGGQAAMFALNIASSYAPELHLVADVAGGVPSQFDRLYAELRASRDGFFLLMMAAGLNAAYGDKAAPLDEFVTPAGMALIPQLENRCLVDPDVARLLHDRYADTTRANPSTIPAWRKVFMANDPENFATRSQAPLLIVQGGSDNLILPASARALATHECGLDPNVELWVYARQSHSWALVASADDTIHWIADRFVGAANPGSDAPATPRDVQRTRCARS